MDFSVGRRPAPLRPPGGAGLSAGAPRISISYVLDIYVFFVGVGCRTYLGCQVVGWNVWGMFGYIHVGVIG